jgi:hypothetical protein
MRKPKINIATYLSDNFPGLTLSPPLFYKWTVGIRFELNGDVTKTPSAGTSYFSAVVHRAERVYRETFAASRYCFAVGVQTRIVEIQPKDLKNSPELIRVRNWPRKNPPGLFDFAKKEQVGLGRSAGKVKVTVDS